MTVAQGLIGDRFLLCELIATGGMGQVWRARDQLLEREVAVKLLRDEYSTDPEFRARFRAEARHAALLSHPGIATVFDYGEVGATAYLVMELVAGEPLSELLRRRGRLDFRLTLPIVQQTAAALGAAHAAGVVHRDVKPGNLLLRPDGVVKVTDFGIARAVSAEPMTRTGLVIGTAAYMSPEQVMRKPVSPASDVYALGVVGYQLLAGRLPFEGADEVAVALAHLHEQPLPLPQEVPEPVRALLARAMDKEAGRRFADGADFALAAQECQRRLDVDPTAPAGALVASTARVTEPFAPTTPPAGPAVAAPRLPGRRVLSGRRRWLVVALGLLALLAAALLITARCGTSGPTVPGGVAQSGPQAVTVPDGLRGKPYDDVAATLLALGLHPSRTDVTSSDVGAGDVLSVIPSTGLHRGDPVAVSVANPYPATPPTTTGTTGAAPTAQQQPAAPAAPPPAASQPPDQHKPHKPPKPPKH